MDKQVKIGEASMEIEELATKRMCLIRYELEIMPRKSMPYSEQWDQFGLENEFTRLDQAVKRVEKQWEPWMLDPEPLFHPGRVLVSSEVMRRLGRRVVLLYLNRFVRGGASNGPCGGESYRLALELGGIIWSNYYFTKNIDLSIQTNIFRTITVIRFQHEWLRVRRCSTKNQSGEGSHQNSDSAVVPEEFDTGSPF